MKIKFSKINLNDKIVIANICDYIGINVGINCLDFSWCQLKAENLLSLAETMAANPYSIRSVNFSYNNLNINPKRKESTESEDSINFITKFLLFIKNSDAVHSVDLSGLF